MKTYVDNVLTRKHCLYDVNSLLVFMLLLEKLGLHVYWHRLCGYSLDSQSLVSD